MSSVPMVHGQNGFTFAHAGEKRELRRLRAPESKIEWLMYDALRVVACYEFGFDLGHERRGYGDPLAIEPQMPAGSYRVDFLVSSRFGAETIRIAVECDGHDYHEKTKAQASRDKRRDRYLQREGYYVFRFTGSDIFNDPKGCAREVIGIVMDWISTRANEAYHGKD